MNQPITVSVGIDWADAKHDFQLISPDGQIHTGVFDQNPKAIADQILTWRALCPGAIFAVAIEATKGAIARLEATGSSVTWCRSDVN